MGSHFKRGLLEEHIMQAIKQWHVQVKNKKKKLQQEKEAGAKLSTNNRVTTDQLPEIEFSSHNRVPTVAEFSAHEIHKISQT